jgi:hypothetical protein
MKLGSFYIVTFWDHAEYEDDQVGPVKSWVVGKLVAVEDKSYEFEMLHFEGSVGNKRFSCLKCAIIAAKRLK